MNSHALKQQQQYSVNSTWTAGGQNQTQQHTQQQQSSDRMSSQHSQQHHNSQIQKQHMSGIHVPDDYDLQDSQAIQKQKEKFFESLGLPPNLQDNTIKAYQPQIIGQQSSSGDQPLDDSSLFRSCNAGPSYTAGSQVLLPQTSGPVYSGMPSNQKNHPHLTSYKSAIQNMQGIALGSAQNIISDSSFITAFDGHSISNTTPGDKRQDTNPQRIGSMPLLTQQQQNFGTGSAYNPQQQSRHNESVGHPGQKPSLEEMQKFEDILVDSQRKHSAPLNQNHQRLNESSLAHSSNHPDVRRPSHQPLEPMTFNQDMGIFNDQRREILTITVDIGNTDGETANILIREGDDPKQLAAEFAQRHGIQSEQLQELLAEQIQLNVEAVLKEEEEYQRQEKQLDKQDSSDSKMKFSYGGGMVAGGSIDQRNIITGKDQYQGMMNKMSSGTIGNGQTHSDSSSRGVGFMQLHQVPIERQSFTSSNMNQNYAAGHMSNNQTTADLLYYQNNHTPNVNQSYNNLSNSFMRQSMQQKQGSHSRIPQVNSSFVSEGHSNGFNTMQNSHMMQYPGTQTYQQWKDNVSNQLRSHRANQPAINENSKKIIENKRQLNNTGTQSGNFSASRKNSGSVHQRLHQQAVSKQRQQINYQMPISSGPNRNVINFVGTSSTRNQSRKTFNLGGGYQHPSGTSSPTRPPQHPRSNSVQDDSSQGNISHQQPRDLINYGERLYQKGIKRKEEQQRMLKEVRQQMEIQQITRDCSFRPEINQISRMIAHPLRSDGTRAEEALIKFGQQSREKLEQKRSEMLFQELQGCYFRPQLAAKHTTEKILQSKFQTVGGYDSDNAEKTRFQPYWRSNSADKNISGVGPMARGYRSNSADKFSDLYQDAMRRRERQDKIYSACIGSECTFKPDTTISKYYYQRLESRDPGYQAHKQQMEGSRYQQPSQSRGGRHFRNLSEGLSEKERLQRSLKKSATFSNELCDPDSGMPYFRPKVGRGPRNQQRPDPSKEKGSVAIMLYNQSKALREKMEFKKRYIEQEKEQNMKKVHTTEKSNYIIEELKIAHFADIFRRLDSDADGQISCQRIDLTLVEPELLGVLEQIFTEMEELGQSLTEEEWVDACCRLYEALPMPQKRTLFNPKEQRRGGQQSKQGKQSYGHYAHRKRQTGEDVAEILNRKKKEYEMKIKEKKQEKENMELVGCTFHPNIIQSPLSSGSSSANKAYSRINQTENTQRPSGHNTMPGSRSSFSGAPSLSNLAQNIGPNISRAPNNYLSQGPGMIGGAGPHTQSFHGGNTSQHTATFHGGIRDTSNNTQTSNPQGFFDLNNLAYNVANEYLSASSNQHMGMGGTFDNHVSNPLANAVQYYRAPSVGDYAQNYRQ